MEDVKRVFIPGEEWLYFKIYCGNYSADYILSNDVLLIVDVLLKNNLIDKWFFIRYTDPENHLRIRFHLTDCKNIHNVMQIANAHFSKLFEKHIVYDIAIATYKREIERYSANIIIEIENLFYCHSTKIIQLINNTVSEYDEITRIFASLLMMHDILKYFGIPLSHCQKITEDLCFQFKLEYSMDRNNSRRISKLYLKYRNDISLLLNQGKNPEHLSGLNKVMRMRKEEVKILKIILEKIKKDNEITSLQLIISIVHMNINRTFRSKQREYEMLCYSLMNQYFKSVIAQK